MKIRLYVAGWIIDDVIEAMRLPLNQLVNEKTAVVTLDGGAVLVRVELIRD